MSKTAYALVSILVSILGLGGVAACGGGQAVVEPEPTLTAARPAPMPAAEPAPEPDPWAAMDEAGLRIYIQARVAERIQASQPDFDLAQLDAYRANPESAPEIAGRTVERLFDLAILELAQNNLDAAEQTVRLIRLKARNRNSAFAGTTILAEAARRRSAAVEGATPETQQAAVKAVFEELPRPRFGSATVLFQVYQNQEQLDARVAQTKAQLLSLDTASTVVFFSEILPSIVAGRDIFLAAIEEVRVAHQSQRPDRDYAFSTMDLARSRTAQPVHIAVWDVGTAPNLFEEQLFTNEAEQANGEDDDGNGLIDDIHGIAADPGSPPTALLYEPSAETLETYTPFLRGIMDLRAGLANSEAAQAVLGLFREANTPAALENLETNLDAVGEWAHGTHVAGIMVAGNPHAQLSIFRSAWAGEARLYHHRGPTDEELAAERANVEAIATYINAHNVRVVNASLGFSRDYVESALRHEADTYSSDAEVQARAAVIQEHRSESWRTVFEACPNTLFVVAAGNSNRDPVEYGDVPASHTQPNLITVGAVDRWGNWATFTNSHPARVRVFDHGVEVDSLIPNGETVPLSGTSMASPNVANLAGKMLAVAPTLTPADLITIITETGDEIEAPFNGVIANERRALTRAQIRARRN